MSEEYKTLEELKEELGNKFEEFMYKANIELLQENQQLKERINKAVEYINKFEDIKAYYSYEENGYEEYNYDEDFKIELLEILKDSNK